MNIRGEFIGSETLGVNITIKMTLGEWRQLYTQIDKANLGHPAYQMNMQIKRIIDKLNVVVTNKEEE